MIKPSPSARSSTRRSLAGVVAAAELAVLVPNVLAAPAEPSSILLPYSVLMVVPLLLLIHCIADRHWSWVLAVTALVATTLPWVLVNAWKGWQKSNSLGYPIGMDRFLVVLAPVVVGAIVCGLGYASGLPLSDLFRRSGRA